MVQPGPPGAFAPSAGAKGRYGAVFPRGKLRKETSEWNSSRKRPRGTVDIVPGKSEKMAGYGGRTRSEAELNGFFGEVRTPVFEHTELFLRGVGDTTDVVEKQMYTFEDKGGRHHPAARGHGRRCAGYAGKRPVQRGLPGEAVLPDLLLPVREAPGGPPAGAAPSSAWRCPAPQSPWPTPRSSP